MDRLASEVGIQMMLGWDYEQSLETGIEKTYRWISGQIIAKDGEPK